MTTRITTDLGAEFHGRTALVTGSGSGIGLEIVRDLLARGATVIAADLHVDDVPAEAHRVVLDVSDQEQVKFVAEAVIDRFGPVDTLFNNAGIGSVHSVIDCTREEWDQVFAVNVRGPFLCIKYFLPSMLAKGFGVIVNTASIAGIVGLKDRAAYAASKGALIALARQVAVQWASEGIRCTCVCPGTVDSPWVGRLLAAADDPVQMRAELVARQPMGRLGTPAEVAKAAVYLASDAAAFITGSELVIDGGISAG